MGDTLSPWFQEESIRGGSILCGGGIKEGNKILNHGTPLIHWHLVTVATIIGPTVEYRGPGRDEDDLRIGCGGAVVYGP